MSEPEKYGTFDDWEYAEINGEALTELMDEMVALACEVDPESAQIFQRMKQNIIDLRITSYKIAEWIYGPNPPMPTPGEEAAAKAEKAEAYRTGGANLLPKRAASDGTGD
jgi:hypothetical protein